MDFAIVEESREAPASRDRVVYAVALTAAVVLAGATFRAAWLPDPISAFEGFTFLRATATLAYLTGCLTYFLWYASVRAEGAHSQVSAWRVAWPFIVLAIAAPGIATDRFLYLHQGHMTLDGANPYLVPSVDHATQYSQYLVWPGTSPYGPVAQFVFAAVAKIANGHSWIGVLLLKLVFAAAHAFVARAAALAGPVEQAGIRERAVLLHPALLLAFEFDVHVDAMVCAFLVASVVLLRRERPLWALVAILAATATKAIAIVAIPLWFAWTLSRRDVRRTALGAGLLVLTVLVGWWTVLPTHGAWSSLTNPISYTCRSIAHVMTCVARMIGGDEARAMTAYERVAQPTFALGAAALWFRRVRSSPYSATQFVTDFVVLMMVACLFVIRWVPWWYASLPLVFTLYEAQSPRLARAVQVYATTSAITLHVGCGISPLGLIAALIAIGSTIAVFLAPATAERLIEAIDPYARKPRDVGAVDPRSQVGECPRS